MKNSEFQKAYSKIISEQKTVLQKKRTVILEEGWDILGLFGGDKDKAKAAKKDTVAGLQDAVKLPEPQEPNAIIKTITDLPNMLGKLTDGVTGMVKQIPIVGNVVGTTIETLNPTSKNFLALDKIPDAFKKDAQKSVQPVQKFLGSDEKGKEIAKKANIDPKNKQNVIALIARQAQAKWAQMVLQQKQNMKKLQAQLQKKHKIQKQHKDAASARQKGKIAKKTCPRLFKAFSKGIIKDGKYKILLQD